MVFAEETTNFENRERVLERPSQVTMPPGVAPQMSHGIGSDSQRPFAIVIVGGLIANLGMSIFLLPTMYVWIAGEKDVLPEPEADFET
jgi:Cu/Ag efflux pump CusA